MLRPPSDLAPLANLQGVYLFLLFFFIKSLTRLIKGIWTKHLQYYLDNANDASRTAKYSPFLGSQTSAVFHYGTDANNDVGSVWYAPDQVCDTFRIVLCIVLDPLVGRISLYSQDKRKWFRSSCRCSEIWTLLSSFLRPGAMHRNHFCVHLTRNMIIDVSSGSWNLLQWLDLALSQNKWFWRDSK